MKALEKFKKSPWAWIPTLYFAQGLPYVAVMTISVILYKRMGMSNTDIALYTGWLGLPWVIKPFWSPFVDIIKTKRWWVLIMQWVIAIALAGIAFTIPTAWWVQFTFAIFMLMGFASATHDIAADGFYMLALDEHEQSMFVGIRSTFYRIATVFGQGILVMLAGYIESNSGLDPLEVKLSADPKMEAIEAAIPETAANDRKGEPRFEVVGQMALPVAVPTDSAFRDKAKSLKDSVNNANIANGFYAAEPDFVRDDKIVSTDDNAKEPAVMVVNSYKWNNDHFDYYCHKEGANEQVVVDGSKCKKFESKGAFVASLENFLRNHFPDPFQNAKAKDNNFAIVAVQLNGDLKPGKEYVLNIENTEGSTDISLGQLKNRFVFNDKNWDKPAYLIVNVDNKVKEPIASTYTGTSGKIPMAWAIVFVTLSVFFFLVVLYHTWAMPKPAADKSETKMTAKDITKDFIATFKSFFTKFPLWQTVAAITFMLFYRFPEAQLTKIIMPFLLDPLDKGGLALSTTEVGIVYGTVGIIGLTIGGIIGGIVAAKGGLKKWLHPMAWSMSLTCLTFIYLAFTQDQSFLTINICVFVEQFGYGFGFTAYMLYLIYYSEGKYKTAHYAICTGFMALSMMMGMMAGWLEDIIGYQNFFVWTMICCLFTIGAAFIIKVDPSFGLKKDDKGDTPKQVEEKAEKK